LFEGQRYKNIVGTSIKSLICWIIVLNISIICIEIIDDKRNPVVYLHLENKLLR
jgi:hypothetical protein